MEQSAPATASMAAPVQAPDDSPAVDAPTPDRPVDGRSVGFSERGRMRRRARFLRKARELAYRDLGGLVYSLHRFGQRNDALVLAKLGTLGQIDGELRTLEGALAEHQPVTVLRDAGITACPRCAAIHGSEDHFCPNCGLAMDRHAERPVAGPPQGGGAPSQPAATVTTPAPASAPVPATPAPPAPAPAPSPPAPAPATQTPGSTPNPESTTATPADQSSIARAGAAPHASMPASADASPPTAPPARTAGPDQPTVIVRPPGPDA